MKRVTAILLFSFISLVGFAQEQTVEMADVMRADGKIYVVVGIILIILVGFLTYMFLLDRKISRLEKEKKK